MSKIQTFSDPQAVLAALDAVAPRVDESMGATLAALKLAEALDARSDPNNKLTGAELAAVALEGILDPGNEEQELLELLRYIGRHAEKLSPGAHQVVAVLEKYLGLAVRQGGTLTPEQKLQLAEELTRAAKEPAILIATPHPAPQVPPGTIVVTTNQDGWDG